MPAEMKISLTNKRIYSLDSFDGIENLRPKQEGESKENPLEDNNVEPLPGPDQSDNQPSNESLLSQAGKENPLKDNNVEPLPNSDQSDNQPSNESSINQPGLDKSINNSDTSE